MPGDRAMLRISSIGLALLLAAALSVVAATSAVAHSQLLSSAPAAGEQLEASPTAVVLTFNEEITELGTQVELRSAEGTAVTGELSVVGPTVVFALAETLSAGDYEVTWRAVSADGHPISGTFGFTVLGEVPGAAPTVPAAPSSSGDPTQSSGPTVPEPSSSNGSNGSATEPGVATSASDSTAREQTPTNEGSTGNGGASPLWWVLGGVAALAAIVLIVWLVRRRTRSDS